MVARLVPAAPKHIPFPICGNVVGLIFVVDPENEHGLFERIPIQTINDYWLEQEKVKAIDPIAVKYPGNYSIQDCGITLYKRDDNGEVEEQWGIWLGNSEVVASEVKIGDSATKYFCGKCGNNAGWYLPQNEPHKNSSEYRCGDCMEEEEYYRMMEEAGY